jgi:hypothetical protein
VKTHIFALILLGIVFQSQAQTYVFKFCPMNGNKWGYADITGKTIIEPKFPSCFDFSENGIAVVNIIKWEWADFLRLNGTFIKPELSEYSTKNIYGRAVKGYEGGFVAVVNNDKWGFLNSRGKIAVPLKYNDVTSFCDGYTTAKRGRTTFILDTNGTEYPIKVENLRSCKHFSEGLAPFYTKGNVSGFINNKGEIVIAAKFITVGYFSSGFAWARANNNKIGFINKKGIWVVDPKFDIAQDIDKESGMALVKNNEEWVYVDTTGNILKINFTDRLVSFSEGMARGYKEGKIGFFNNKGSWVIEPKFDGVRDFKNGYCAAKLDGKWGIIDKKGDWVIEPSYSGIGDVIKVH